MVDQPADVAGMKEMMLANGYVADQAIATAVFLALTLERPLLLEGEAGVGKTEIANTVAAALDRPLVRLQCYEGLDVANAAYEWNYSRQLLHIRAVEAARSGHVDLASLESDLYSEAFLLKRPLLRALELSNEGAPPVLLVDELDRADAPFEAFLLEILADYRFTIPELGPIVAERPPLIILTSNRTREIHDAVRRRCFYQWVDYPSLERELAILRLKAPEAPETLRREVVRFIQSIRQMDLYKNPGIAETINWAQALTSLSYVALDATAIDSTLGTLLKYQDDIQKIEGSEAARLLGEIKSEARAAQSAAEADGENG